MNNAAQLSDALIAAGVPVVTVREYTDAGTGAVALEVVYPADATPEQRAAGEAVRSGFDTSPGARAARALAAARRAAFDGFFSRGDDTAIAVRAMFEAVLFLVNNRLQALGQTRVLKDEVVAYLMANPTIGDPTAAPEPGEPIVAPDEELA